MNGKNGTEPGTFDDRGSLREAEEEASRVLAEPLGGVSEASLRAYFLIGRTENLIFGQEPDSACRVCVHLLNRAANDLLCATWDGNRGYTSQAATLAASMFEALLSAAYIEASGERAEEWAQHGDPLNPFRSVSAMVTDVFGPTGPGGGGHRIYGVYRELCLVKHVNPLHATQVGSDHDREVLLLFNGPDTSENSQRTAHFALENLSRLVAFVCDRIASGFAGRERTQEVLGEEISGLLEQCRELGRRSLERWGEPEAAAESQEGEGDDDEA